MCFQEITSHLKILNLELAPDVQLAPCMAASAISEGPCDELASCSGCCPRTETAGIGSSTNPRDSITGIKRLQTVDGWMDGWMDIPSVDDNYVMFIRC